MASDPPDAHRSDGSSNTEESSDSGDTSHAEDPGHSTDPTHSDDPTHSNDPTHSDDPYHSDDPTVEALHRIELGLEWFHRAHGHLVAFHHNTGHAMDHFAAAEELLREQGEDGLADDLRDEFLPCGVLGDRWSYDVLETFQEGLLADADALEERARDHLVDGNRHVAERQQERAWKGRASGWETDPVEEE